MLTIRTERKLPFAPFGFSFYLGRRCGGSFGIVFFRYRG